MVAYFLGASFGEVAFFNCASWAHAGWYFLSHAFFSKADMRLTSRLAPRLNCNKYAAL